MMTVLRTWTLALLVVVALGACGDDDGGQPVTLSFQAMVGSQPAECGPTYENLGIAGSSARLADARLFVSRIELRTTDGEWKALTMDDDGKWQGDGVALLDFEDGTASCSDSGSADVNDRITGTVPAGTYQAVRFDVGIPFELNHIDGATAPAPLSTPGMFWTWQGGYKFLRADWLVDGGAIPRWNVHLGSTMCDSSAPIKAPEDECARPNRATLEVGDFDPDTDVIRIDLAQLVAAVDITANTMGTPPGCQSTPSEPDDCGPVFDTLGMSFDAGGCAGDCADQSVFTSAEP